MYAANSMNDERTVFFLFVCAELQADNDFVITIDYVF
jgi:hypothetical protein